MACQRKRERLSLSGLVNFAVVGIGQMSYKCVPISLMFVDVVAEAGGQCLVVAFRLVIGLRVISSNPNVFYTKDGENIFKELRDELRTIIGQ